MSYVLLHCTADDCGNGRSFSGSARRRAKGMSALGWSFGPSGARCPTHRVAVARAKTTRPYVVLAGIVLLAALLLYLGSR